MDQSLPVQDSVNRTQAIIDFFLSKETKKEKAWQKIDQSLFEELKAIVAPDGSFNSLEYLKTTNFMFTVKSEPLQEKEILRVISDEVEYRRKKQIASLVLDSTSFFHRKPLDLMVKEIQTAIEKNTPKIQESAFDAKINYNKRKNRSRGFISGIKNLDTLIDGFEYGTMTTIAGFSGQYKTTLLMNLMYNALTLGYSTVFITLEVPKELLYYKLLARHSFSSKFSPNIPVNFNDVLKSKMTAEQETFLFDVVEKDLKSLSGQFLFLELNDIPDFSAMSLMTYLKSLGFKPDAIFLDYIQLLVTAKFHAQDPKYVGNYFTRQFTQLAVGDEQNRYIVFLAAQTNREGYARAQQNNGKYDLRSIAEINQLEKDSSYIICPYLDDSLRASGEVKISLIKNRFGEITDTPIVTHADPRFGVIGDDIEGFSDPITRDEASSFFTNILE